MGQRSLISGNESIDTVEKLRQPSMPAEEDSQPYSLLGIDSSDNVSVEVDKVQVMNELEKHSLTEVIRTNGSPGGGTVGIDPDYFLRLINSLKVLSYQLQEEKCT